MSSILASLSLLAIGFIDDVLFQQVLNAFQKFAEVLGLLGLVSDRNSFIGALCRISIPGNVILSVDGAGAMREISFMSPQAGQAFLGRIVSGSNVMGERNVICLKVLLNMSSNLKTVLDDNAWFWIVETLQAAEGMMSSGKMGRKETMQQELSTKEQGRPGSAAKTSMVPGSNAGGGNLDNQFVLLLASVKKFFEDSKTLDDKCFSEFVGALCRLAQEGSRLSITATNAPVSGSAGQSSTLHVNVGLGARVEVSKSTDEKLYSISKLNDVVLLNSKRFIAPPFEVWDRVMNQMIDIAHSSSCSPGVRAQVCQAVGDIITAVIQEADLKAETGKDVELKLMEPLRRLMLVDSSSFVPTGVPAIQGAGDDGDKVVRGAWFVDVQKSGLESLHKILQSSGQGLGHSWVLVFDIIRSVVSSSKYKTTTLGSFTGGVLSNDSSADGTNPTVSKASILVKVAFPSLQMICTDFLGLLEPVVLFECVETLGCFGSQTDDLNISLTAIGQLWSLSDHVLTRKQQLEKNGQVPVETTTTVSSGSRSNHSVNHEVIKAFLMEPVTTKTMDTLWMHLLAHLSQLCSDPRPEVRNSANQTLFRTIGMNGKRLTLEAWDECIWNVLFPLLERVKISSERVELMGRLQSAASGGDTAGSPVAPPVRERSQSSVLPQHHSRNSVSKQWDETKVLTLNGVTSSVVNFFPVLAELGTGFDHAWSLFLDYIRTWCLGGSPEVASAAVKSLRTLVRYPKEVPSADGTPGKVAPSIEGRMMELWRVAWDVWEAIGLGVVAGADENAGTSTPGTRLSGTTNNANLKLLHGNFAQETLNIFVNVFPDIHDVIKDSFGLVELRRLLAVLSSLLLYHTHPSADSVLALTTGAKVEFDGIRGAPEAIMATVAGFIRLPFVRLQNMSPSAILLSKSQPQTGGMEKGFTYIALSKKAIQALVGLFEKHGALQSVYSGGTFEVILSALEVPMRAKYDCPSPGVKDSTPLWRYAANTAMTLVSMGLTFLDTFVADLPGEILNGIYVKVLEIFDGFLLTKSSPPANYSPEELAVDTDFDISIFETFENYVITHMGQVHVQDDLILGLVKIILRCSELYVTPIELASDPVPTTAMTGLSAKMGSLTHMSIKEAGISSEGLNTIPENPALRRVKKDDEDGGPPVAGSGHQTPRRRSDAHGAIGGSVDVMEGSMTELGSGQLARVQKVGGGPVITAPVDPEGVLGSDVISTGREKFAKRCLECLCQLCSDELTDMPEIRHRVATIAAPVFLDKARDVIKSFAEDRSLYGRMPMARLRSEELLIILNQVKCMNLRAGILHKMVAEDKIHPLRAHILSGKSAHLFILYPYLCDLLCTVSKCGRGGGPLGHLAAADPDEERITDYVRECLGRVGREFGIDA
ncbi:hypothetical protein HDU76_005689 [Blyttiomyces sp. JEL0837]|nr:hypothetical protein HDU76_005689 [Blyttiomyces sp. JEL0837]